MLHFFHDAGVDGLSIALVSHALPALGANVGSRAVERLMGSGVLGPS
jgi:hypothetical protein